MVVLLVPYPIARLAGRRGLLPGIQRGRSLSGPEGPAAPGMLAMTYSVSRIRSLCSRRDEWYYSGTARP